MTEFTIGKLSEEMFDIESSYFELLKNDIEICSNRISCNERELRQINVFKERWTSLIVHIISIPKEAFIPDKIKITSIDRMRHLLRSYLSKYDDQSSLIDSYRQMIERRFILELLDQLDIIEAEQREIMSHYECYLQKVLKEIGTQLVKEVTYSLEERAELIQRRLEDETGELDFLKEKRLAFDKMVSGRN